MTYISLVVSEMMMFLILGHYMTEGIWLIVLLSVLDDPQKVGFIHPLSIDIAPTSGVFEN